MYLHIQCITNMFAKSCFCPLPTSLFRVMQAALVLCRWTLPHILCSVSSIISVMYQYTQGSLCFQIMCCNQHESHIKQPRKTTVFIQYFHVQMPLLMHYFSKILLSKVISIHKHFGHLQLSVNLV